MWRTAATQAWRLLRVLFLWIGAVPADSDSAGRWRPSGALLPMLNTNESPCTSQRDWTRRPGVALTWWCAPIIMGVSVDFLSSSPRIVAVVWAGAFVWMGIGCLLNAHRCHRLHCYFSGPVLLLGAVVVSLLGFGVLTLGPHALNNTVSGTLLLALLSFVPEVIWGK